MEAPPRAAGAISGRRWPTAASRRCWPSPMRCCRIPRLSRRARIARRGHGRHLGDGDRRPQPLRAPADHDRAPGCRGHLGRHLCLGTAAAFARRAGHRGAALVLGRLLGSCAISDGAWPAWFGGAGGADVRQPARRDGAAGPVVPALPGRDRAAAASLRHSHHVSARLALAGQRRRQCAGGGRGRGVLARSCGWRQPLGTHPV